MNGFNGCSLIALMCSNFSAKSRAKFSIEAYLGCYANYFFAKLVRIIENVKLTIYKYPLAK